MFSHSPLFLPPVLAALADNSNANRASIAIDVSEINIFKPLGGAR